MILRELNVISIIIRMLLSAIFGGIFGFERGTKNHPAGIRTYMLVCVGSAVVMMTNQFIVNSYGYGDPSRLGAQVISGIGFLGAGTILTTQHKQVRGLTTAAGLWGVACLGLAIGIGFYEGAIIGGSTIILIMTIFSKVKYKVYSKTKYIDLFIVFENKESLNDFFSFCSSNEWKVIEVSANKHYKNTNDYFYQFSLVFLETIESEKVIKLVSELNGVIYVEEVM